MILMFGWDSSSCYLFYLSANIDNITCISESVCGLPFFLYFTAVDCWVSVLTQWSLWFGPSLQQKRKVWFRLFFPLAFIGKETSILKYCELPDSPLSICNVQFLCSALTFWATASSFPVLCWTHLGVNLLRRCHWVFYLLMFMPVISTLSAPGRHSTSHFEMQCNVWTQSSDAGKKRSNNVLEKKGLGGLRGKGLNQCQMVLSFTWIDGLLQIH